MRRLSFMLLLACSGSTLRRDLLDAGADAGGTTLEGWVVDATTDAGLAGAQVFVGVSQTVTGPDGTFFTLASEPGLQTVEVTAEHYFTGIYMVQLLPGSNQVELRMERDCTKVRCPANFYCGITSCQASTGPAAIVGQITDLCDQHGRLALIDVTDDYGTTHVCTDAEGNFRIAGRLGGESVTVKASAPGYTPWSLPLYLQPGDNDFTSSLSRDCGAAAPAPRCP